MTYISLYRKWRSQTFEEIVGQPHITRILINAINNNRLGHAYIFSGPRGTGKTTIARILAKASNCRKGFSPLPCGKCDLCVAIQKSTSVDVMEIDGASNRGIDQIREIKQRVNFVPLEGRYKFYIIDEAHMLTTEAFNALLKTLEEPPLQTIFILATTDVRKIPLTIQSRCQRLDFRRISEDQIREHLIKICEEEKFKFENEALELLSRLADGSLRDAISLLEQIVVFGEGKAELKDIFLLLGLSSEDVLQSIALVFAKKDFKGIFNLVEEVLNSGKTVLQLAHDLLEYFRSLLLIKEGIKTLNKNQNQLAESFTLSDLGKIIKGLNDVEINSRWFNNPRIIFDIFVHGFCSETAQVPMAEQKHKEEEVKVLPQNEIIKEAPSLDFTKVAASWSKILENIKKKSVTTYALIFESQPLFLEKNKLFLGFKKGFNFHFEKLKDEQHKHTIKKAVSEILGEELDIEVKLILEEREVSSREENLAIDTVSKDIFSEKLIDIFGAQAVE